ncbi:sentrin-specific protease 8-like [Pocillopora damicornis]|uniref:sentrin-specific protease 8-like n=1 Tax=Pocillopora damicornis TaxID=46731 RepID=UPI000F559A13|nr:sentrin-specific protease 8-like [Pocillopora damicornis]
MADEIVLSFHDSLLKKSDLSLLEEGRWLNDRLIGFVFDYFTHNKFKQISDIAIFISPDVTQFLKLGGGLEIGIFLEPLDLLSRKLIFFAVNDNDSRHSAGGSHWSLLAYCRETNSFHHYDSSSSFNTSAARSLAQNVEPFLHCRSGQNPSFKDDRCPQQQNGYDCGLYVVCITEQLCTNFMNNVKISLSDTLTPEDIRKKRKALKELVLSLGEKKT